MRLALVGWGFLLLLLATPYVALAQQVQDAESIVMGQARVDGAVWVYHTEDLPLGYGYHIYRNAGSGFIQLTDEPVYGATSGQELLQFMDPRPYARLAQSLQEAQTSGEGSSLEANDARTTMDAHEVLFNVRGDRIRAGIATFLYPGMARALGRLYVDEQPPQDSDEAVYRFEFVDAFGEPAGESIQGAVSLQARQPAAPVNLTASNDAHVGTIQWEYPRPDRQNYDGVGYFEIYEYPGGEPSRARRVSTYPVFRRGDISEYRYNMEVPFDTTLHIVVEAIDIANQRTTARMTFSPVDNIPPGQVQNVQAEAEEREVEISWDPLEELDVVGYRVYRSNRVDSLAAWQPLHDDILPVYQDAYRDTTIGAYGAKTLFYHVVSVDDNGNEGPPSAAGMGQVEDHSPPAPITGLEAAYDAEEDIVRLSWNDEEPAPDLQTYSILRRRVERGRLKLGVQLNNEDVTVTTYEDEGPDGRFPEGATYRYSIAAVDSTRNSSARRALTIEIPDNVPPAAPGQLQAYTTGGQRILVSWDSSPSLDVSSYVLYRAVGDSTFREIARLPASGLRFEDRFPTKGQRYRYTVEAVDDAGNVGPRAPEARLSIGDSQAPRTVRGVRAVAGDDGVTIQWEGVPDEDLAGYRVRKMPIATGIPQSIHEEIIPAGTTHFVDESGRAGVYYEVTAYDIYGNHSLTSRPEEAINVP